MSENNVNVNVDLNRIYESIQEREAAASAEQREKDINKLRHDHSEELSKKNKEIEELKNEKKPITVSWKRNPIGFWYLIFTLTSVALLSFWTYNEYVREIDQIKRQKEYLKHISSIDYACSTFRISQDNEKRAQLKFSEGLSKRRFDSAALEALTKFFGSYNEENSMRFQVLEDTVYRTIKKLPLDEKSTGEDVSSSHISTFFNGVLVFLSLQVLFIFVVVILRQFSRYLPDYKGN